MPTFARQDCYLMMPDTEHDTIAVTLQLPVELYEAFSKKARKAGMGLETYLSNTLTAALGGTAADAKAAGSPKRAINGRGQ